MDGVKSEMVTWAVGRAGEGLQGLGNAPYPLPLILHHCCRCLRHLANGSGVTKRLH